MNIIVTGGGGFLGTAIVRQLLTQGHQVKVFGRSHYPHLEKLGVPLIKGDISKRSDVEAAIKPGVDVVFHCAAIVGLWGKWEDYFNTNVQGTRWVIGACQNSNVKVLVHTSSPSAVFGVDDLCGVDETVAYPTKYVSHYARSKKMAEELMLAANKPGVLATACLRPHLIMGPGDPNLIPRIISKRRSGKLMILGNGQNKVDIIHVENAALAHLKAMEKLLVNAQDAGGRAYFVGQEEPILLWPFINEVLGYAELTPVTLKLPGAVAYFAGWALEKIYALLGIFDKEPPMTRFLAKQLSCSHYFNHNRVHTLLDFHLVKSITELKADLKNELNPKT